MSRNTPFNHANSNGCPCENCPDRVPEPRCHMTCEKYKAWREKIDRARLAEQARNRSHDTMSDAKKREIWKARRYKQQFTRFNKMRSD